VLSKCSLNSDFPTSYAVKRVYWLPVLSTNYPKVLFSVPICTVLSIQEEEIFALVYECFNNTL
jgi:hypothetical protein